MKSLIGANPYRAKASFGGMAKKLLQMGVASLEMAAVLHLPFYRARVCARMKRPVNLIVFGAQKSGTTWLHAQLESSGLGAVSPLKECHHFDRGRMWSLRNYLSQFENLPKGVPVAEVAPDYGTMARWRIRAMHALFPDAKIVFIGRNPVDRAWSGTKMETAFDRGWKVGDVPVRDFVDHLRLSRSRRYSNYARQISNWAGVFGRDRLRCYPFDMISQQPQELLADILEHVNGTPAGEIGEVAARVFPGEFAPMPEAVRTLLHKVYRPQISAFRTALGAEADTPRWQGIFEAWERRTDKISLAPEQERTLLFLCGFAPNPKATSSGQKLAHSKITALAGQFREVRLIYFINELDSLDRSEITWPDNVNEVGVLELGREQRIRGLLSAPRDPGFVSGRRQAARATLEAQLSDPQNTDFYADFSQGLAPVPEDAMAMFRFRQHDVVSKLYERQASHAYGIKAALYGFEASRARHWEARGWTSVMQMNTLSAEDAIMIADAHPDCRVVAEPVRGTLFVDPAARTPATVVPGRIGFWGNMARGENVDALQHMVNALLPRILDRCSEAHFWIIGAHPTKDVLSLASENVHITGFLEDPTETFASLDLAVVPLRLGSGVKIKVFEMIDAGIPTVVSPVGGEGIEGHPLLDVAQDDDAMVEMIVKRLSRESWSRVR